MKTLLEIRHVVCTLILSGPSNRTLAIHGKIACRLPPAAALGRSNVDALIFSQFRSARDAPQDMHEARCTQSPCSISFALSVDDDLEIGLRVLGRIRQRGEPSVCRLLITVGNGYEVYTWMSRRNSSQVQKRLLSDYSCVGKTALSSVGPVVSS